MEREPPMDDELLRGPQVDKVAEDVAMARVRGLLFGASKPPSLERYVLLEQIGKGTYGAVYSAWDPRLDRKIAIKVLHGGTTEALEQEARALAKLSHPNIVAVHDVGEADGALFLAMEFVDGAPLSSLKVEAVGWRKIVATYRQAVAGLAAAHDAGVIHRDFKPTNALLGRDGRVRVLDFGLAREGTISTDPQGALVETRVGGTPLYMAPEQHRGDPIDARSDQYGFCAALWEALHGTPPFEADALEALVKAKNEPPRAPASTRVPAPLTRVLIRGMAPDPVDRYPSMRALDLGLARTLQRRTRVLVALGAASVAIAVGTAVRATGRACTGADDPPARWTSVAREEVAAAFKRTGLPHAHTTARTAVAALDDWARTWGASRKEACLTHDQGLQSDAGLDRRIGCLDAQRHRFDALLDVFAVADPAVVDKAVDAVAALPPPSLCENTEAPHPIAPAERDAVEQARPQLARGRAELDAGHYREAADRATDTIAACDAAELQHPPTCVEARLLAAESAAYQGQHDSAVAALRGVAIEAQGASLGPALARAAYQLTWELSQIDSRFDEALTWAGLGRASLPDGHVALHAQLSNAEAAALGSSGRVDEALALYDRQLARLESNSVLRVPPLTNRANVDNRRGNYDDAERGYAEAIALSLDLLGATHPKVLTARQNRAGMWASLGRFDDAIAELLEILSAQELVLGTSHPDLATTLGNLSYAYAAKKDADPSLRYAVRAATLIEKAYGDDSQLLIEPLLFEADAYTLLGQHGEALARGEHALRISTAQLGAEHTQTALSLRTVGVAHIALGDPQAGREALARAAAIFRAAKMPAQAERTEKLAQSKAPRSD